MKMETGKIETVMTEISHNDTENLAPAAFAGIWERARDTIIGRVDVLDLAAVSLLNADLDVELRRKAEDEAHKLVGLVGTFGFIEASTIAREIESLLHGESHLGSDQTLLLSKLAVSLRQELERHPASLAMEQLPESSERPEPSHTPETADVLIVDDDEVLTELLVHALENRGYSCRSIQDGQAAVDALSGFSPSIKAKVVLLDVGLPSVDGLSVLRILAKDKLAEQTRLIMLTARSGESEVLTALELGAFDHVAKPFSLPVLMQKVQRALDTPIGVR